MLRKKSFKYYDNYTVDRVVLLSETCHYEHEVEIEGETGYSIGTANTVYNVEYKSVNIYLIDGEGDEQVIVMAISTTKERNKVIKFLSKWLSVKTDLMYYMFKDQETLNTFVSLLDKEVPMRVEYIDCNPKYISTVHSKIHTSKRINELEEKIAQHLAKGPSGFVPYTKNGNLILFHAHTQLLRDELGELIAKRNAQDWYTDTKNVEFCDEYRTFTRIESYRELGSPELDVEYHNSKYYDEERILCAATLRGRDTLIFSYYNTLTREEVTLTNPEEIMIALHNLKGKDLIAHDTDALLLMALYKQVDIQEATSESHLAKLVYTNGDVGFQITRTKHLDAKLDTQLEAVCYNHIRVKIEKDETLNNIQRLQCLKYLFDTRLIKIIAWRGNLNLSSLCEDMWTRIEPPTYVAPPQPIIEGLSLKEKNFVSSQSRSGVQSGDIILNCGETGNGGLYYMPSFWSTTKETVLFHLDFESFYPTILLNNPRLVPHLDMEAYTKLLEEKRRLDKEGKKNSVERSVTKAVLNRTHGLLMHKQSPLYAPSSYAQSVHVGHNIMLLAMNKARRFGAKVVGVQTDGMYLEVPIRDTWKFYKGAVPKIKKYFQELGYPMTCTLYTHAVIRDYNVIAYRIKLTKANMDCTLELRGHYRYLPKRTIQYVLSYLAERDIDSMEYPEELSFLDTYRVYKPHEGNRALYAFGDLYKTDERGMEYLENYEENVGNAIDEYKYSDLAKSILKRS